MRGRVVKILSAIAAGDPHQRPLRYFKRAWQALPSRKRREWSRRMIDSLESRYHARRTLNISRRQHG